MSTSRHLLTFYIRLALVFCQFFVWYVNARHVEYPDFHTEKAREVLRLSKSAEMRNYIRTDVDPCDNFYKYACGNWHKINPARVVEVKTGLFNVLKKAYNRRVVGLMRQPKRTSEADMERKVRYFYESCLNKEELRSNYRNKLLSVLEEFGGMPALKGEQWQADNFDWLEVVALILRKYGKQIIIGADIFSDLTNNEVNRLYLGQLDELVPPRAKRYYSALRLARQIEMQQLLGMNATLAAKTVADMIDFEMHLAAGMVDPQEGLGNEDKAQLRLLDAMTESYKPTLNLTRFVNVWLGHPYYIPVYEYVDTYFINLRYVIENTPKSVVANYIMWELLQEFRMEPDEMEEKHLNKCVERTKHFFVKYLDNMVYRQLLQHNNNIVEELNSIWIELKTAFRDALDSEHTDWLSESTRSKAVEKLNAMSLEINSYEQEDFDSLYGDLVIGTNNYFENVISILEVRGRNYRQQLLEPPKLDEGDLMNFTPAYSPEFNKVLIPVAFMQPRYLWDDVYPVALKFATIGYSIAHEMAHGFDGILRKYDAKGNLNNWWDRNSTEEFLMRKECFKQQYSEFTYNSGKLPKVNAQDENIADNAGVRLAYAAYQHWLLQMHHDAVQLQQESLPHMDYTPRQLFFIGLAQVWCTDINHYYRQILADMDIHAPEEVRVLGMMSNFDEFAMEFKCSLGSRMNPVHKCVMY